ncbi:MAG: hypothetical protein PHS62_03340 [Patescibacteria group bacterium]|nr:hypothetical protein [Patescibacteria group bacterium]
MALNKHIAQSTQRLIALETTNIQMKIKKTTTEQHCGSIPLEGWNNVVEALIAYDSGLLTSSRATQDNLKEAIGQQGGVVGLGLLSAVTAKVSSGSGFVTNLLSEAQKALKTQDRWHRSYDYDAMGTSFFKSSVDIEVIDRKKQIFTLGINAAYVGDKPEEDLAKYLGVQRALHSSTVIVQTDRLPGDRFSFDFEAILRKLNGFLGAKKLTGEEVVKAMLETDRYGESKSSFVLKDEGGLTVSLAPGRVEGRFKYAQGGKKTDTWESKGANLSGLLADSYEH